MTKKPKELYFDLRGINDCCGIGEVGRFEEPAEYVWDIKPQHTFDTEEARYEHFIVNLKDRLKSYARDEFGEYTRKQYCYGKLFCTLIKSQLPGFQEQLIGNGWTVTNSFKNPKTNNIVNCYEILTKDLYVKAKQEDEVSTV